MHHVGPEIVELAHLRAELLGIGKRAAESAARQMTEFVLDRLVAPRKVDDAVQALQISKLVKLYVEKCLGADEAHQEGLKAEMSVVACAVAGWIVFHRHRIYVPDCRDEVSLNDAVRRSEEHTSELQSL